MLYFGKLQHKDISYNLSRYVHGTRLREDVPRLHSLDMIRRILLLYHIPIKNHYSLCLLTCGWRRWRSVIVISRIS